MKQYRIQKSANAPPTVSVTHCTTNKVTHKTCMTSPHVHFTLQTATGATKPTIGSPCTTFTAHMAVYVNRNVDWRAIECSQPSPACHPLPMNLGHNRSFLTSKMPPLYQTTKFCSARGCSPSRKLFHQCAAAAHHLAVPLSDAQEQVGATQDGHRGVAHPTGSAQGEGGMAAATPGSEVGERPE